MLANAFKMEWKVEMFSSISQKSQCVAFYGTALHKVVTLGLDFWY